MHWTAPPFPWFHKIGVLGSQSCQHFQVSGRQSRLSGWPTHIAAVLCQPDVRVPVKIVHSGSGPAPRHCGDGKTSTSCLGSCAEMQQALQAAQKAGEFRFRSQGRRGVQVGVYKDSQLGVLPAWREVRSDYPKSQERACKKLVLHVRPKGLSQRLITLSPRECALFITIGRFSECKRKRCVASQVKELETQSFVGKEQWLEVLNAIEATSFC